MPFMEPQAIFGSFFHVETDMGTEVIPGDLVGYSGCAETLQDYLEGGMLLDGDGVPEMEELRGWYSRFSAPGYMDCTDWLGPYDSREEALVELARTYDVCIKCWEACWDDDSSECPGESEAIPILTFTREANR